MDLEKTVNSLTSRGFLVTCFDTKEEATEKLAETFHGKTIGVGGSVTLREMNLLDALKKEGEIVYAFDNPMEDRTQILKDAATADIYITSANAISKTGEIVNIDGTGNRVASTMFGHEQVYIISGINKIEDSLEKAIWRARNIASPLNARRLNRNTPCAHGELRCHDCNSNERICRGMTILMKPMGGVKETHVVLILEELGF